MKELVQNSEVVVTKKRNKIRLVDIEDIYKILNKVQIYEKEMMFSVVSDDSKVAENIIKDLQLEYKKKELKTKTTFTVSPGDREVEEEFIDIEFLQDELKENGQLF